MAVNYIDALAGKIEAGLAEEARPSDQASRLYDLYALLALVKGGDVTLEDVHNAWSVWMSEIQPGHPALVPFQELDADQREQDRPYVEAIRQALSA